MNLLARITWFFSMTCVPEKLNVILCSTLIRISFFNVISEIGGQLQIEKIRSYCVHREL